MHVMAMRDRDGTWRVVNRRRSNRVGRIVAFVLSAVVVLGAASPFLHLAMVLAG